MKHQRRHFSDSAEVGWISMVDLLVVIVCIGLLFIAFTLDRSSASARDSANADQRIGALEEELARSTKQAGDWTVTAKDWERKYRELLNSIPKPVEGSDVNTQLSEALANAQSEAQNLKQKLDEASKSLAEKTAELEHKTAEHNDVSEELGQARAQIKAGEAVDEAEPVERGMMAQQLVGIGGALDNVIFVVDRSSSMSDGDRWQDAKTTVLAWVRYLPVKRAAVVLFGSNIQIIPPMGATSGPLRPNSLEIPMVDEGLRTMMRGQLEAIEPEGATPTYRAIQRAMDFKDIDAIILFTDGRPDPTRVGADPLKEVEQLLLDWRGQHPNSRVHVVAQGEYFTQGMKEFLFGVARAGGGNFIGR